MTTGQYAARVLIALIGFSTGAFLIGFLKPAFAYLREAIADRGATDYPDRSAQHQFAAWSIIDDDLAPFPREAGGGFWTFASAPKQRRRCTECGLTQEISIGYESAKGVACATDQYGRPHIASRGTDGK